MRRKGYKSFDEPMLIHYKLKETFISINADKPQTEWPIVIEIN